MKINTRQVEKVEKREKEREREKEERQFSRIEKWRPAFTWKSFHMSRHELLVPGSRKEERRRWKDKKRVYFWLQWKRTVKWTSVRVKVSYLCQTQVWAWVALSDAGHRMSFFFVKLLCVISSSSLILFACSSGVRVHFHQPLPPTVISTSYPISQSAALSHPPPPPPPPPPHAYPESHHFTSTLQHSHYPRTQFTSSIEPESEPEPEGYYEHSNRGFVVNLRLPRLDTSIFRSMLSRMRMTISFAPWWLGTN